MSTDTDGYLACLPRYIRNLNTWAQSFGLTTEMTVEPYTNSPEERLWGKWSGTRAQLMELVQPRPSYRLPLKRGQIVIPKGLHSARDNCLLTGEVAITGDQIMLEIDFGAAAYTVSSRNEVETVTYEEEILHHGSMQALINMGVTRDQLPTASGRRRKYDGLEYVHETDTTRPRFNYHAGWCSVLQPDGQVLYRKDTTFKVKRRQAESDDYCTRTYAPRSIPAAHPAANPAPAAVRRSRPAYLHLIVNNT